MTSKAGRNVGWAVVGLVGLALGALLWSPPDDELFRLERQRGLCKVMCFSPRHDLTLARMTRPADPLAPAFMKEFVEWGAGPRASQYLVLGAKARAALEGRPMADLDDVRTVALPVLRHRVVTNFSAEAADRTSEDLVQELVSGDGWLG